jgi:hypothetical protein
MFSAQKRARRALHRVIREDFMRFIALFAALVICSSAPAHAAAAWHQYVDEEIGYLVNMPGEPVESVGEYRTGILGRVPSRVLTTEDRGMVFTVTMVDVSDRLLESASILQEVVYIRTRNLDIASDSLSRADPGPGAVYGRRVVEDTPDGGRVVAAFYLTKGLLFLFEVTIPPGGDKGSPLSGRFVDSVSFDLQRDWNIVPGGAPE